MASGVVIKILYGHILVMYKKNNLENGYKILICNSIVYQWSDEFVIFLTPRGKYNFVDIKRLRGGL